MERHFAYEEAGRVVVETVFNDKFVKPKGWVKIKAGSLPDRKYRSAWRLVGGAVVVDEAKAKEIDAEAIRRKRAAEYPPAGDALDALAKWAFSETEIGLPEALKSWAAKCMSVKAAHPK